MSDLRAFLAYDDESGYPVFDWAGWDQYFHSLIRSDNGFDGNINASDPRTGRVEFVLTTNEPRFKNETDGWPRVMLDYGITGKWIVPVENFLSTEFYTPMTRRIDQLARFIGVAPGDRNMPYFAGSSNGSANALVAAERAEYLNLLDQYDYEKSAGSDPWRAPITEHEFFMVSRNGPAAQSAFIARAGQGATPEDNKQWRIANGVTPEALWGAGEQAAYAGAANAWERSLWQSQQHDNSGILGLGPVGDLIAGAAIGYFTGGMLGPIWDSIGSRVIEAGAVGETASLTAAEALMPAWAEVDAGLVNAYATGGGLQLELGAGAAVDVFTEVDAGLVNAYATGGGIQVPVSAGEIARTMQSLAPPPAPATPPAYVPEPAIYTPPPVPAGAGAAVDVFTEVDAGLVNAYATGGGLQTGLIPGASSILSTLASNAGTIKSGAGLVAALMAGGKSNPPAGSNSTPRNGNAAGASVDNSGGFADSLQTLSPALTFGAALLAAVLLVRRKKNG